MLLSLCVSWLLFSIMSSFLHVKSVVWHLLHLKAPSVPLIFDPGPYDKISDMPLLLVCLPVEFRAKKKNLLFCFGPLSTSLKGPFGFTDPSLRTTA